MSELRNRVKCTKINEMAYCSPSSRRCWPMSLTVSFWWGGMKTRPRWLPTPFESCPFKFTTLLFKLLFWKWSALSTSFAVDPLVSALELSELPLVCMSLESRARFAGGGGEPSSPVWCWESRPTTDNARGIPCKPGVACWELEDPRRQIQTLTTRYHSSGVEEDDKTTGDRGGAIWHP